MVWRDAQGLGGIDQEGLHLLHGPDSCGSCCEFDPLNSVLDALGLQDLDRPDNARSEAVGSGASFHIVTHFYDPDLLSWGNTALVESKAVFLFGVCPGHPLGDHALVFHNRQVGQDFDLPQFIRGDVLVVGKVKPGMIFELLGSCLPDVVPEDFPCSIVHDVGCGVVPGKGHPPLFVHITHNQIAFAEINSFVGLFNGMDNDAVEDLNVHHFVDGIPGCDGSGISRLTSAFRIEESAVQHEMVVKDIQDNGLEFHTSRLVVEEALGHREVLEPLGKGIFFHYLFFRLVVKLTDNGIEVIRELHTHPKIGCYFLCHLRGYPMGIIEFG